MITIRTQDGTKSEQFAPSVDKSTVEAVFGRTGAFLKTSDPAPLVVSWNGNQLYVVFGTSITGAFSL